MPDAVKKGEKIRMVCRYDLEGETLYTLKWYKQEQEFFRYTPKDSNSTKFFPIKSLPALDIVVSNCDFLRHFLFSILHYLGMDLFVSCIFQRDESFGDQVTVKKASLDIAGRFLCEVTTDIPSFHALSGHGELRVAGKSAFSFD